MTIPFYRGDLPYLTTAQMQEVDRAMVQDFHIELVQMMENAGRNLAHLARIRFLDGQPENKKVVVLAGTGGNGGVALVCARRLQNWGAQVQICLTSLDLKFTQVPAHQLDILRRMKGPVITHTVPEHISPPELVIDGLIGYSLKGVPYGPTAALIRWANSHPAPILALDVPSGVEAGRGVVYDPAIKATATMTLALPKLGLRVPGAAELVGELYLADISVPPSLYSGLGLNLGHLFTQSDIIRIA